jgi:hypothetical protein
MWSVLRANADGWVVFIFVCRFLDAYGDTLFNGSSANVLMFFTEALGGGDLVPFIASGLYVVCIALYALLVANKLQDDWPEKGPFYAIALCKGVSAVCTLVVLALAATVPDPSIALVACSTAFNVVGAAADAFDSLAFFLVLMRLGAFVDTGEDAPYTDALFLVDYMVGNAAALAARFTTAGVRAAVKPAFGLAGYVLGGASVLVACAVVVAAGAIHRHYAHRMILRPTKQVKEETAWVGAEFWPYALFSAALLPAFQAFVQLDMALPDYMKRRYAPEGGVLYPLFQAINPFLILVLVPLFGQFVRWPVRHAPLVFAAAMTFVALSFVWPALAWGEWCTVVGLTQFTIGEALVWPRIQPYIAKRLLDQKKVGYYSAFLTLPRACAMLAILLFSSTLLDTYCPLGGECSSVLWWWVGGVALLTPVALLGLYAQSGRFRCREATVAERELRL